MDADTLPVEHVPLIEPGRMFPRMKATSRIQPIEELWRIRWEYHQPNGMAPLIEELGLLCLFQAWDAPTRATA